MTNEERITAAGGKPYLFLEWPMRMDPIPVRTSRDHLPLEIGRRMDALNSHIDELTRTLTVIARRVSSMEAAAQEASLRQTAVELAVEQVTAAPAPSGDPSPQDEKQE